MRMFATEVQSVAFKTFCEIILYEALCFILVLENLGNFQNVQEGTVGSYAGSSVGLLSIRSTFGFS